MGTEDFLKILDRANYANGKIIGEDGEFIKTELAKTDRQAWVNHLVEQYLKHESIDDPPIEFKITKKDMLEEFTRREIKKMFGKE